MKTRLFTVALATGLVWSLCQSAQAKTVSINFQSSIGATDFLNPNEVAGFFPVANWNNLNANSGVLDGTVSGQLVDHLGNDSGMIFSWGSQGGREANLPVAPATAGDQKLFRGGREGDINANNQTTAQFKLENMNTAFPGGYDIIWYFGDSNLSNQAGFGIGYRSTDGTVFTFNNNASDPDEATLISTGTVVIPGNQAGVPNGVAFNGTYTFGPNGNSFLDVGLSDDTLVYSFRQKAGGSSFWGLMNVGVQIVGVDSGPLVPEPSTYALGLFALAAVGFVAWRRRRN